MKLTSNFWQGDRDREIDNSNSLQAHRDREANSNFLQTLQAYEANSWPTSCKPIVIVILTANFRGPDRDREEVS